MAIADLPLGVKWTLVFDPSTGGYVPSFTLVNASGEAVFSGEALITIDYPHHEVHEGNTYQVTTYTGTVANGDSWGLLISLTGASKNAHAVFEYACGGDAEIRFYENVTGSNYGTKMTSHNLDHASSNTAQVEVFRNPTITVLNDIVFNVLSPGGSGGTASGGVFRSGTEHILAAGKRYYLQAINRAGTSKPMSVGIQWYEDSAG